MNYNDVAKQNNLKKIRKQKGVTQHTLAVICSQTASDISRYERGKCMPGYIVLRRIVRFLEVSVEKIYPELEKLNREVDESVERGKAFIVKHSNPE